VASKAVKPAAAHPGIDRVLLSEPQIAARIKELGAQISRDYAGRPLVLIGILKGGVVFLGDLMRRITLDVPIDFMCVSSYAGKASTGAARLLLDLRESVEGKDLLLVEDIMDTGLTLQYLVESLKARGPRSVEICALLDKAECRKVPVEAKYVGFKIADEFVVGFGLDYNERYRNLPYVAVLKDSHGK
jgi:hypoxanthine phosphoribosyltransferase